MSSIHCPYCSHHISLVRGSRSGKFFPRCARCQRKYILMVPAQADMPPFVSKVEVGHDAGDTITPDIAGALGIEDSDFTPPAPGKSDDEKDDSP